MLKKILNLTKILFKEIWITKEEFFLGGGFFTSYITFPCSWVLLGVWRWRWRRPRWWRRVHGSEGFDFWFRFWYWLRFRLASLWSQRGYLWQPVVHVHTALCMLWTLEGCYYVRSRHSPSWPFSLLAQRYRWPPDRCRSPPRFAYFFFFASHRFTYFLATY